MFTGYGWPLAVCTWSLLASIMPTTAQNISTNMQIPALQWINLSQLTKGGSPPTPLLDAHIAFDAQKKVLVLFGGESSAGVPTQQTYLLEMDTLTWRIPLPPGSQVDVPPPRSAGVYGQDIASNYREGMLVYGGRGGSGSQPLDDLWYYHYQNEFWVEISTSSSQTSPGARWGAAGGTAPASTIQNIETFMWLAGGSDGTNAFDIDDVWQLSVNGVIAAGSNAASGVWDKVPTTGGMGGGRFGLAGTILPPIGTTDREGTLVLFGGCPSTSYVSDPSGSCASPSAQILSLPSGTGSSAWNSAGQCPPGSSGSSMAPNRNIGATTFGWEAFLFPSTGDQQGEVAILSANSGVWARVIPAGDPSSNPLRPTFKEGTTVYAHDGPIAGGGSWSDTVVFGGRDVATGQLTNELWLLRAYDESITSSSDKLDGTLQTGVNASGAGVQVTYLQDCASPVGSSTTTNGAQPTSSATSGGGVVQADGRTLIDASPVHDALSPISVGLVLLGVILFRGSSSHQMKALSTPTSKALLVSSALVGIVAYGTGVGGFAVGWNQHSSTHYTTSPTKRSSPSPRILSTTHARTALALWIVLYILIPLFALILWFRRPRKPVPESEEDAERRSLGINSLRERKPADETTFLTTGMVEKERTSGESVEDEAEEFPSRRRDSKNLSLSLATGMKRRSDLTLQSTVTAPATTITPPTPTASAPPKFEVVNRPKRASLGNGNVNRPSIPRNHSDLSWPDRRRSINMYGQLDYELSQTQGQSQAGPLPVRPPLVRPSSSGTHEVSPATPAIPALTPPQLPPSAGRVLFDILLQLVLFWAITFWIVSFAVMGKVVGLVVLALVAVVYYVSLVILAWMKRPRKSILVVIVSRLRGDPTDSARRGEQGPEPEHEPESPSSPVMGLGTPYMHSPPWRVAGDEARSLESEPADDEDDEVRQARMEEEMARRDVSIFTVPKRRLVVRN